MKIPADREIDSKVPDWSPAGHYYSPIVNLAEVRQQHCRLFDRSTRRIAGVDLQETRQRDLLDRLLAQSHLWQRYLGEPAARRFAEDNPWFNLPDAAVLFLLLHHLRPRRIIEIGSGYSSSIMMDVADRLAEPFVLTCIDPEPQRLRGLMTPADHQRVTVLAQTIQTVPDALFDDLGPGDILFIDTSHVTKTGNDVNHIYFNILPRVRPGVWVHIHDVFHPFEYPEDWVYEGWGWNEIYLVRAFLMHNDAYRIELFPSMLQHLRLPEARVLLRDPATEPASSLWLSRIR